MEKIINKLIDEFTKGVDTYTHNGSTWLIFTDKKEWVIELTESKTLWYNYNFFKGVFAYVSMDVVENQSYITKWVEDNIIGGGVKETQFNFYEKQLKIEGVIKNGSIDSVRVNEYSLNYVSKQRDCEDTIENGVKETTPTLSSSRFKTMKVEDTIENGVKETHRCSQISDRLLEDTIQNGVKETISTLRRTLLGVDDIIQNGIKETRLEMNITEGEVDDIIQDGVKLTQYNDNENKSWVEGVIKEGVKRTFKQKLNVDVLVKEIIQDGVKETNHVDVMGFFNNKMEDALQNGVRHTLNTEYMPTSMVEDIIENGIKETKTPGNGDIVSTVEWLKENNSTSYPKMIDDVIDNGVKKTMLRQHITDGNVEIIIETGIKEVQPLPDQSGELIGYGNYYKLKEDRTKPFIDYLEDTIKFGIKN
jgi:hypothetical protein